MPTLSSLHVPAPKSWDEFEEITLSALQIRWKNLELFRHGRQGQKQDGVDIYGNNASGDFVGVQCKNSINGISERLVKGEIEKAESFTPKITMLFVASTASRDAKLQKAVRALSEDRKSKGLFPVDLLFWDDIYNDLAEDEDKFFKHYPQFKPKTNKVLEHDRQIFKDLMQLLPSNGVITFLDKNKMAGFAFKDSQLDPIREFHNEWHVADKEFLDNELERLKKFLYKKVDFYLEIIATETWSLESNLNFRSVPSEWESEQPARFWEVVRQLHDTAQEIVNIHQSLVRYAKENFSK